MVVILLRFVSVIGRIMEPGVLVVNDQTAAMNVVSRLVHKPTRVAKTRHGSDLSLTAPPLLSVICDMLGIACLLLLLRD